jgi:hypothetical protein
MVSLNEMSERVSAHIHMLDLPSGAAARFFLFSFLPGHTAMVHLFCIHFSVRSIVQVTDFLEGADGLLVIAVWIWSDYMYE